MAGLQFAEKLHPRYCQTAMRRGQYVWNTCGTRSPDATAYILFVSIYWVPRSGSRATRYSKESAQSTQQLIPVECDYHVGDRLLYENTVRFEPLTAVSSSRSLGTVL